MGRIPLIPVTGSKSPAVHSISFIPPGIHNRMPAVNQGMIHILLPIICIPVFQTTRIKSQVRIMGKKQRTSVIHSQRQKNAVKFLTVPKNRTVSPSLMIYGIVNRMGRRRSSQDISNLSLIVPTDRMIHLPTVIG